MEKELLDTVNSPKHYEGKKECIDAMIEVYGDEAVANFCLLNAFKYVWRMGKKQGNPYLQDLKKAKWYYAKFFQIKKSVIIDPEKVSIQHIIEAVKRYTDVND